MMLCAADFDELFPRTAEPERPREVARAASACARANAARARISVPVWPHPMLCLFALAGMTAATALEAASAVCAAGRPRPSAARLTHGARHPLPKALDLAGAPRDLRPLDGGLLAPVPRTGAHSAFDVREA